MSIKNLIKILIYILILSFLKINIYSKDVYDWTYNLEKGRKQYNTNMYDDAADNLKIALKKNNQCFEAANILAYIFLIKKDIFSAEEYFLISLKINDNQPDIHMSMGEIDEFFLRNDSAITHYKKSLSINSDNPKALIGLARVHYRKGDNVEAEKYFNQCYNAGIADSENIYNAAEKIKRENPLDASHEFKRAIEINPAHIAAYIGLADSYRSLSLYDDAAAIMETLKKNKPDNPISYIYLGNIYFNNKPDMKRRKYFINLSISNYEKAIKLDPENVDLYFQLADIYKQIKDMERASELLKTAEDLLLRGR
ncbi:MAG: tetratricopeptide repeat protein [Leptospirales bacterium]|nr:tetratricopeptide repeat protein [Leptospirales bacterium]